MNVVKFIRYLPILTVIVVNGCIWDGQEKVPAAQDLLDFFSSACKNNNVLLDRALSQTDALETTLRNLQKNDACGGVANILPSVQDKNGVIRGLLQSPTTARKLQAQENVRWLTTGLAHAQEAGDTNLQEALSLALIDAKLEFYDASSAEMAGKTQEERERLANGLTVASNYTDQLLKLQGQLSYCARENPYLALQIASSAMAVSGSFLQPQFGAAIMLAGSALGSMINYLRTQDIGKAIYSLDAEKMDVALPCVLESISNTYCESRNFVRILDFSNNGSDQNREFEERYEGIVTHNSKGRETDPFLRSLRLLTFKVPDLIGWIRKVAIGVTPNDSFSADRVTSFIDKYAEMQMIRKLVEGVIGEIKFQIDQDPGEGRPAIARIGLRRLVGKLFWGSHHGSDTNAGSTPIAEVYNYTRLVYRLAQDQEPPSNLNEQLPPQLVEFRPAGLTFATIAERALGIVNEVGRRVSTQLTTYNITNASKLLSEAREIIYGGSWEPITVIGELIDFLYDTEEYHRRLGGIRGNSNVAEIQKTRELLEYVATLILAWNPNQYESLEQADEEAKKVIEDLFRKLILIYGENYLAERIVGHVRADLINRMLAGEAPRGIREILWASSRDIIRALVPTSEEGQTGRHDLRDGLLSAMQVSMGNAKIFTEAFQLAFTRSMIRLTEQAKDNSESSDQPIEYQPHLNTLAQMCILLLTTNNQWPEFLDPEICRGAVYHSVYKEVPPLKFDDLAKELKGNVAMPDRFCKFNQYRQNAELARRNVGAERHKRKFF